MDEMDRPVMGAAIPLLQKDAIRVSRKATLGEKHRLNSFAQLFIRQEQQALSHLRV